MRIEEERNSDRVITLFREWHITFLLAIGEKSKVYAVVPTSPRSALRFSTAYLYVVFILFL